MVEVSAKGLRVEVSEAGFREGRPVIKDVEFSLSAGELLLVTGPSGSGKTTLILTITGVLNNLLNGVVKGTVDLYGVNPLTPEGFLEVPRLVGVVLQDPEKQLSMPTPADEVAFTLENLGLKSDEASVINSLKRFDLDVKAFEPTESLSGGEKKRLCIAASVVHKPKLVIFDEPTANLDPWGVSEAVKYINWLRDEGSAVIVVEHKARYFLKSSDKVMVLSGGREVLYLDKGEVRSNYDRIVKTLDALGVDASEPNPPKKAVGSEESHVLVAEDIWFRYPTSRDHVLRGVSLALGEGDVGVVVGRNGSGKTTLLKVLSGLYKPERGYVNLKSFGGGRRGKGVRDVFYVPQEPDYMFVHGSVLKELRSTGKDLTTAVDEAPWIKDVLNESPYRLSHGQRRWLSYLISKLYDPKVVLFDEPTAGLDSNLLRQFVRWVEKAASEGRTVLIASHDVRLLCEVASKAYVMDGGKLTEVSVGEAVKYLERPLRGFR